MARQFPCQLSVNNGRQSTLLVTILAKATSLKSYSVDTIFELGRSFQLGEGWHSNINAVRFWNSSPRIPKETHVRCYALATAYVMMIPPCNRCSTRLKRPTHSRS